MSVSPTVHYIDIYWLVNHLGLSVQLFEDISMFIHISLAIHLHQPLLFIYVYHWCLFWYYYLYLFNSKLSAIYVAKFTAELSVFLIMLKINKRLVLFCRLSLLNTFEFDIAQYFGRHGWYKFELESKLFWLMWEVKNRIDLLQVKLSNFWRVIWRKLSRKASSNIVTKGWRQIRHGVKATDYEYLHQKKRIKKKLWTTKNH